MLITFSGLDGAGKSTLIAKLRGVLEEEGRRVTVLTMYDHVGLYAIVRGARDTIRPPRPGSSPRGLDNLERMRFEQERRGPLRRRFYSLVRGAPLKRGVYRFDLVLLRLYRWVLEGLLHRVVITDRYFYDTLADIAPDSRRDQMLALIKATPVPDVPVFVDVDPRVAFERKHEYPVDYMERRRDTYRDIFDRVPGALVVSNDDIGSSVATIVQAVSRRP